MVLSCIEGFLPSFTHIKCSSEVQSISHGKPVNREVWRGRNSTSDWIRIRSNVECLGKESIRRSPGCPTLPFLSRGRRAVPCMAQAFRVSHLVPLGALLASCGRFVGDEIALAS